MTITPASSNTAASFVNALGVNTHLSYGDTAYANTKNVLSDVTYEGVNETNIEPVTYNGLTRMPAAAALQQAIYAAVEADGQLAAIPVYNTTLGGGSQAQYSELGNLSNACDFGNGHIYPSGGPIRTTRIASRISACSTMTAHRNRQRPRCVT